MNDASHQENSPIRSRLQALGPQRLELLARRLEETSGGGREQDQRRQLVAFLELSGPGPSDSLSWKTYLREQLPEYMVPQRIEVLENLPRLANGKLDRQALRIRPVQQDARDTSAIAPVADDLMENMKAIWAVVLQTDTIYPEDNFFELGGDSLLSINVVSRAKQEGIELNPGELFDFPVLAELCTHLAEESSRQAEAGVSSGDTLHSRNVEGSDRPLFMVHGGKRMLRELRDRLGDDRPIHLLPSHWDSGDIDRNTSIEALAKEGLNRLRDVQPAGPYLVGGYSIGAIIAVEMVQQLLAKGEEVDALFLLDPPEKPGVFRSVDMDPDRNDLAGTSKAADSMNGAGGLGKLRAQLNYYRGRLLPNARYYGTLVMRRLGLTETDAMRSQHQRMHVAKTYLEACRKYSLLPVACPVILFRATEGFHKEDIDVWRGVAAQKLMLEEFDCDHIDMQWNPEMVERWTGLLAAYLDNLGPKSPL